MEIDPRLKPGLHFVEESEEDALKRYDGFGADAFPALWRRFPELRTGFEFFRNPETDDLWSLCRNSQMEFGLQLDPDLEVICLWNKQEQIEIGTWYENPIEYVIDWIRNLTDFE